MEEAAPLARREQRSPSSGASCCRTSCRRSSRAPRLAFARAVGEFGPIVLISGNILLDTQVSLGLRLQADRERRADQRGGGLDRAAARLARGPGRHPRCSATGGPAMTLLTAAGGIRLRWSRSATWRCCCSARSGWIFLRTFEHGVGAVWEVDHDARPRSSAFWPTLEVTAIAVPLNTLLRDRDGDARSRAASCARQGPSSTR